MQEMTLRVTARGKKYRHNGVRGPIQEGIVKEIDMDIFRSNVFEKYCIDLCGAVNV